MIKDRIVELIRVRAGDIAEHPSNWRIHPRRQREALRGILSEIGYADALLARREGQELVLIDGHLRRSLDPDQMVPVLVLDLSAEEAEKLLAVLDPLASLARPDPEALAKLLSRTSFTDDAVADLLEEIARQAGLPARQVAPAEEGGLVAARSRPGDLWAIGEHRLLCGDSREPSAFMRLLGAARADLLVTDPPYGVGYVGKTPRAMRIQGDHPEGLADLLDRSLKGARGVLRQGAPAYVFSPSGAGQQLFLEAFSANFRLHQTLAWIKNLPVLGHCDYHYRHEMILFGYAPSPVPRGRGRSGWYGGNDKDSVIEVPRPKASAEHPTEKPVELLCQLVENSSRAGQAVLDPFAGGGSTLVSAAMCGRRGFGIEISPGYADVALARLEHQTGLGGKRVSR